MKASMGLRSVERGWASEGTTGREAGWKVHEFALPDCVVFVCVAEAGCGSQRNRARTRSRGAKGNRIWLEDHIIRVSRSPAVCAMKSYRLDPVMTFKKLNPDSNPDKPKNLFQVPLSLGKLRRVERDQASGGRREALCAGHCRGDDVGGGVSQDRRGGTGVDCPGPDAGGGDRSEGRGAVSHRLRGRPDAFPGVALLAPVDPGDGAAHRRMAGLERVPGPLPGDMGLALLEDVSGETGGGENRVRPDGSVSCSELGAAAVVGVGLRGVMGELGDGAGASAFGVSVEFSGSVAIPDVAADRSGVGHGGVWRVVHDGVVFGGVARHAGDVVAATGAAKSLAGGVDRAAGRRGGGGMVWFSAVVPPEAGTADAEDGAGAAEHSAEMDLGCGREQPPVRAIAPAFQAGADEPSGCARLAGGGGALHGPI